MRSLKTGILALVVIFAAVGIVGLQRSNASLQRRMEDLRRRNERKLHTDMEDQRIQSVMARAESGDQVAVRLIEAQLLKTRAQVANAEKRAVEKRAQWLAKNTRNSEALARNRDPEQGVTRLEYFQNVGRATPGAAFQTVIWAVMKGDDDTLARSIALSDDSRQKAAALIATLPSNQQAEYPTPEKLMTVFLAQEILANMTAAQVVSQTTGDAQAATVAITSGLGGKMKQIPFQLGTDGWQLVVPPEVIDQIQKKLLQGNGPGQPVK